MKLYIVMEIGCLECAVESKLVSISPCKIFSENMAMSHISKRKTNGQIEVQVFEGYLDEDEVDR